MTNEKRGPGQPPKGARAKTKHIGVRVSEADHDLIEEAALIDAGLPPATWVRQLDLTRARKMVGEDEDG